MGRARHASLAVSPPARRSPLRSPLWAAWAATASLVVCAIAAARTAGDGADRSTLRQLRVQELTATVHHLDEVLTMSANMAAATGEARWQSRYDQHVGRLDDAIAELRAISPSMFDAEMGVETDEANQRLVAMERRAFELVTAGHLAAARTILDGPDYAADKRIYAAGNQRAEEALVGLVAGEGASKRRLAAGLVLATLAAAVTAAIAWVILMRRAREQRVAAELSLARASMQAAEVASRHKSQFVAGISHELRTPLTAILGYAELGADESLAPRQRAAACATIVRSGQHLLQLLNDLLDLAKVEAGAIAVEPVPTDVRGLVDEVLDLLRLRALDRSVGLERHFAAAVPARLCTDPGRLRQILLNLVGNALKFTSAGRVTVDVQFVGQGEGGELVVAVADTGIGMTAAQVARLFQPFVQGDDSTEKRFGGTGLGLVLSRHYARLLGGDIEVQSEAGQGSVFTLRLHGQRPASGDSDAAAVVEPRGVAATPSLAGLRILVADDGRDLQRLTAHHLQRAGADVVLAVDGQQAIDRVFAVDQPPVDLVLMDMQMPGLDGYQATRRLRERGVRLPIVALTAGVAAAERERCFAAGCDAFLGKPLDRQRLLQTCRSLAAPVAPPSVRAPTPGA